MITDLLFYDPGASTGEFYMTERGGIDLLQTATNWRQSWSQIIPGKFGGTGTTDLLFYDPITGTGEFYTVDNFGGLRLLQQHTGWRTSWTAIVPGNFGGGDLTDLLFFEAASGTGEFYATDGQGGISMLQQHTGWRGSWNQIVPGNFGGSGHTDLLFYDAAGSTGEFYTSDGLGGITQLNLYTDWRSTWLTIVPGVYAPLRGVRVHLKVLQAPSISTTTMLASMRQVYASAGLRVVLGTIENLNLPDQLVSDVGDCADGYGDNITGDQWVLYHLRRYAAEDDIVLYFVATIVPAANGCAKHPDGRPGAIIDSGASTWTVAHEVGHVLGLGHVDDNTRLMTENGTSTIVGVPKLSSSEIAEMHSSDLTFDV